MLLIFTTNKRAVVQMFQGQSAYEDIVPQEFRTGILHQQRVGVHPTQQSLLVDIEARDHTVSGLSQAGRLRRKSYE